MLISNLVLVLSARVQMSLSNSRKPSKFILVNVIEAFFYLGWCEVLDIRPWNGRPKIGQNEPQSPKGLNYRVKLTHCSPWPNPAPNFGLLEFHISPLEF